MKCACSGPRPLVKSTLSLKTIGLEESDGVSRVEVAPRELGLQDRKGGATADPRRSLSDQFGAELPVEAFSGWVRDDLHHSATLPPRSFRTLLEKGSSDPKSLYRGPNP